MKIVNTRVFARAVLHFSLIMSAAAADGMAPVVGEKAPDFELMSTRGTKVRFSERTAGPVVLVVLRGFPGYQCPNCNRQVQDFIQHAPAFAQAGASVVFVYPGPPDHLAEKAGEFLKDKTMPEHFDMLLDPDYGFTKAYGLRWNAPKETAYPSTFVVDRQGVVVFSKVVKSHGGRSTATEILSALPPAPRN